MKTLKNSGTAATSVATTTTTTMAKRFPKSWDHVPRKRRRYSREMNLMLLTFLGFCSCLMLWPDATTAAATMQDFGSVTAKGENIFMLASIDNDDDLGNTLPGEIREDDNDEDEASVEGEGFARNNGGGGDATNDGKMPLMANARKEHAATEDIEMMQLPHDMRHQEHYKQRMPREQQQLEMSSNDFQLQNEKEMSWNNRHLRYQQIQQALREPITPLPPVQQQQLHRQHNQQPHHQHRHHHAQHHHHHVDNPEEFKWPLQHQFRHHHQHHQMPQQHHHYRHHEHLRHQHQHGHNLTSTATTTTTTTSTTMRPRYFDRDGLYTNPLAWMPTTEGPLHAVEQQQHAGNKHHFNPHNHLFNDEDMDGDNKETKGDENKQEEFKRISLSLDANKESTGNEKLFDNSSFDNDNDDDDDDDDYSYEDDNNDDKNKVATSSSNNAKTNVKRYTSPIRTPFKAAPSSSPIKRQHSSMNTYASVSNADNSNEDYESNDDGTDSDNNEDTFSDEKWNKIEHEHYRKQQQHQRAMQALRSRRPTSSLNNNLNTVSKAASSKLSAPSKSTASAKMLNDENIYSRDYIPGSVTRKKEEELGSRKAVAEARRQYILQQRQNKALASAHHRRIEKEGKCRLPQPRVERIRIDSWKIYTPHCTILHRCADDTGCCPSERQTCAPKRIKNVDLYFFVISLNETQGSIERLTFVNHTECHCVDKAKVRSIEIVNDDASASDLSSNHIPYMRRATILNCNCPNLFEKILQEDGYCRCDCSSGNTGCDWLKRGMEHFSMNDRKCISEGRCKLPTCEYGAYIKRHGRCPRREERQLSVDAGDW